MKQINLGKLIDKVLKCLETFELSTGTMKSYKYSAFSALKSYFSKHSRDNYSRQYAKYFVKYSELRLQNNEISSRHYRKLRRAAVLLDEYYTTGNLKWNGQKREVRKGINKYFSRTLQNSLEEDNVKNLAAGTIKTLEINIIHFFKYLENKGHKDFSRLSNNEIKDFILFISPNHRGSMNNILYALRQLFRYLKKNAVTNLNADYILQKPQSRHKKVLPAFTHEEVRSILNQIDISTNLGKRDYAVISLAAHTGLRLSDILNMKLTDISWIKKEIHVVQCKTGNPLITPFETGIGNAVSDYILNGRPQTDCPYIFIRTVAPYIQLSCGNGKNILQRYYKKAGITHIAGDGKSFHALRRGISTWLLEAEVPLSVISQVLGHKDQNSAKQYLSLNYSGLTECVLSLQNIPIEKEELL